MVELINKLSWRTAPDAAGSGAGPYAGRELARELGYAGLRRCRNFGEVRPRPISLHTPLGIGGWRFRVRWTSLGYRRYPSGPLPWPSPKLQEQFKQVLETLSPREAGVIEMRYGLEDGQPKTLDDIGRVWRDP